MKIFRIAIKLVLLAKTANAFVPVAVQPRPTTENDAKTRKTTSLRAHISEWRDLMFDNYPKELVAKSNADEPIREICILPFPLTDILLQGETKELCLYEERFHKLFEKATTDHAGIVAMGFIAPPNGMLQGMPLCEIENFRTMEGDTGFGNKSILATIRVVGRATLLDVQPPAGGISEGYMTGWCQESPDDETTSQSNPKDNKGIYSELVNECDELFGSIVDLKEKIQSLEENKQSKALDNSGGKTEVLSEATLRRMKLEAELGLDDDDDEEDDEDDYLDDDEVKGPRSALQKAIQTAKISDTQGYMVMSSGNDGLGSMANEKWSIQNLTALSWAYLNKDVWGEEDDEESTLLKYRLQALNTNDVVERFMLVRKMLKTQKASLRARRDKLV